MSSPLQTIIDGNTKPDVRYPHRDDAIDLRCIESMKRSEQIGCCLNQIPRLRKHLTDTNVIDSVQGQQRVSLAERDVVE